MNIRSSSPVYPAHSPHFGKIVAIRRFDFAEKDLTGETPEEKKAFMKSQIEEAESDKYGIPKIATGYATTLETGVYANATATLFSCLPGKAFRTDKVRKGEIWKVFSDTPIDMDVEAIKADKLNPRSKLKKASNSLGGLRRIGPHQVIKSKSSQLLDFLRTCFFLKSSASSTFNSKRSLLSQSSNDNL